VQSVPFSFLKTGFQSILRDYNFSHSEITRIIAILMTPWIIKFLWAPLMDWWCGNRFPRIRKAILVFQVLGAALLGYLATMQLQEGLQQIISVFFVISFVAATQDIAVDAFAVLTLPKKEHGLGNTMQIGGYYLGEVLGGALILIILDKFGWAWAMWAFMLFFLIPFIPVLLYKETNEQRAMKPAVKGLKNVIKNLLAFFTQKGMLFWLLVMVIYMGNQVLSRTLLPSLLTDMGYTKTGIGALIGIWGNTASVGGAILGGLIIDKVGRKNSLVGFGLLKVVSILGFLLISSEATATTWAVIIFNDFTSGLATVTLFTIMMDKCRFTSPGTDFTIQQCANQLAVVFFVILSGILVKGADGNFTNLFYVAAILGLVGVLFAFFGLSSKSLDSNEAV
jgi:MFS transporter, PAT family, beta-lactamase induction signal transducer AmpG